MPVTATGIAWYRREDYDRLKAMFTDGDKLPDTFDLWLENAERVYDTLTGRGLVVVKAVIGPDTFPAWCRAHGMEMDAKARMAYGSEWADEKYRMQQVRKKRRRRRI